jgi:hypothetical protein
LLQTKREKKKLSSDQRKNNTKLLKRQNTEKTDPRNTKENKPRKNKLPRETTQNQTPSLLP